MDKTEKAEMDVFHQGILGMQMALMSRPIFEAHHTFAKIKYSVDI
jgi:hypothetical protein